MIYLLLGSFSYLLGSLPTGKLLCSYFCHIDIQKRGSGNIGFANVRRICGWKIGLLTLLLDVLKGAIPTYTASLMSHSLSITFLIGSLAILGHVFPIWLHGHGGKGIATGLGVISVLSFHAAILGAGVYVLGLCLRQSSAVASLLGVMCSLTYLFWLQPDMWWIPATLFVFSLWTLRANITGTVPDYG